MYISGKCFAASINDHDIEIEYKPFGISVITLRNKKGQPYSYCNFAVDGQKFTGDCFIPENVLSRSSVDSTQLPPDEEYLGDISPESML